jgi:hypothetical protein
MENDLLQASQDNLALSRRSAPMLVSAVAEGNVLRGPSPSYDD